MGQFSFEANNENIMEKLRFAIVFSLLLLEVSSSNADTNFISRYPSCKPNSTMPKLEGIIKSSMQDVLFEFFTEEFLNSLKPNSESDQSQNQTDLFAGCPIGWFRILNSCLWVSPKDTKLSHDDAYMYCKRKISGGQLFEPRSKVQNDYAKDLVDAIDGGEIYGVHLWIGINDHMEEGKFVYSKSEEPILFENWASGQPNGVGATKQNCVTLHNNKKWYDLECASTFRFICEKYPN